MATQIAKPDLRSSPKRDRKRESDYPPEERAQRRLRKKQRKEAEVLADAELKARLPELLPPRISEIEPYIAEQETIYLQIAHIHYVAVKILEEPQLAPALSDELCPQLLAMVSHFLASHNLWSWPFDADDEWPIRDAAQIVGEVQRWAMEFAQRWGLLSEDVADIGAVDPSESPVGWYDLSISQSMRAAADRTADALEEFLRLWQRCALVRDPNFLFDEGQRHRLVQACQALLGVLRADLVERNLAASVGKRTRLAELALAAVIGALSGAAGGLSQGAVDNLSPGKLVEAKATQIAASNLGQCLVLLDHTLVASKPEASADAPPILRPAPK